MSDINLNIKKFIGYELSIRVDNIADHKALKRALTMFYLSDDEYYSKFIEKILGELQVVDYEEKIRNLSLGE